MSDTPPPLTPNPTPLPTNPGDSGNGKKVGIGCGIGCLILLIVAVVAAFAIFGYLKRTVTDGVANFTAEQPVAIDPPQTSPDQIQETISRFDTFAAALKNGETPEPLALSDQDINILVFNHPDFQWMDGRGKVAIADDKMTSTVSVDLDELKIPVKFIADAFEGKYFNGEVTVSVAMAAGRPTAFIDGLSVNGQSPPEEFMAGIRQENLLQNAQNDPKMKEFFEKISDLKIENDKLVIVPK